MMIKSRERKEKQEPEIRLEIIDFVVTSRDLLFSAFCPEFALEEKPQPTIRPTDEPEPLMSGPAKHIDLVRC